MKSGGTTECDKDLGSEGTGPLPDGGIPSDDGGVIGDDAGSNATPGPQEDSGGCGCRTTHATTTWPALLLIAGTLRYFRRRR